MGEAATLIERALTLSRERFERATEARALYLLGEIAAFGPNDDRQTAARYYDGALSLAGELGLRPLIAHCHLGLAKLFLRTGKNEEAQEHLTTATTMYREMDMRFWLEQAEAEQRGA